jgi:Cu/Ag efflux protein CusF
MKSDITQKLLVGCAGIGALALALAAAPARAADPAPSNSPDMGQPTRQRTETMHATATVTSLDKKASKVTIKDAAGEKTTIQVPADMKSSYDKLKVGDKIDIDYTESVAIGFLPPGSKPKTTETEASIPGAAGRQVSVSAEVIKVDPATNHVTLKGPNKQKMTISVEDPELQAKLPTLKPGQVIVVQYTEAVAAAIQPAAK